MSDRLHLEILPPAQKKLWLVLGQHSSDLAASGFYLAGGTALSLQIGHRQSVDFDFFSRQPEAAEKLLASLEQLPDWQMRDRDAKTIHGEAGGVKVSLISGYKYPTIDKLRPVETGLQLASVREIGAMKLLAITHRAVVRDYIDMAIIIRDHYPLEQLLNFAEKKHGPRFNRLLPLRALVSFADVEGEWPKLFDQTIKDSWQLILRQAVKNIA